MAPQSQTRKLCLDLPTERDAMEVARRIANKLAEGRHIARAVTVTDEHGNVVGTIPVPLKH